MMKIGVDVGGTNTDAVLIDGDGKLVASCKQTTTTNISDGIVHAIDKVITESGIQNSAVRCVMIGTTHFVNAFIQRKDLLEVGVVRICLPAMRGIPPMTDWPGDVCTTIGDHRYLVEGGFQYDGRLNSNLDEGAVARAARELASKGVKSVAVTGLFSTVDSAMEERAEEIIRNEMEDVSITLSHRVSRSGLLERENATIINASLVDLAARVVDSFRDALHELNIRDPFYINQNDGTLMSAEDVRSYPVLTFASGPTNSMRGAAHLSGQKNALVSDIGGTTTDIGILANGFPRESSLAVNIGGVRTNFRMPDTLSIGLGGGSMVEQDSTGLTVGPQSVGYELQEKALIFGGDVLTASDIGVAAGYADFGNRDLLAGLSKDVVEQGVERIHQLLADGVDRMKISAEPIPLILVGGGAVLIDRDIPGVSEVIVPDHAGVANAIGASIAQVTGEVDQVLTYDKDGREAAMDEAKQLAVERASAAGAVASSIEILEMEEIPLTYAPEGTVRLRIKAAGEMDIAKT